MGDGRHRQDPGGHGRYLIAALGVLIVLTLLATGGYALYSVLTAKPKTTQNSTAPASPSKAGEEPMQRASVVRKPASPAASLSDLGTRGRPTIELEVTGTRCYVSVHGPDGEQLLNRTLRRGETARFGHASLQVTVGDRSAVRIVVNGQPHESGKRDSNGVDTFTVSRSG